MRGEFTFCPSAILIGKMCEYVPLAGLTHEITIVRGQGREGEYAEDRSIRVLGVENPSVSLLPRRDEYTRVYTTVYPRVHYSIHACTLPGSKYIPCRAHL